MKIAVFIAVAVVGLCGAAPAAESDATPQQYADLLAANALAHAAVEVIFPLIF